MVLHGTERKESQLLFLAFAATSAAVFRLGSASSSIFELNAQQGVSFRPLDRSLFQAPNWEGTINGRYWVKNAHVEPTKELNVPLAATFAKPARGAKGVSSIESWLTVCYLLWFNVNTASLNLNTSCHIDFMFMDAVEVLALLVNNGLLLSHKNGYRECCQLSKVTPLQWTLNSLLAWISGVKDQSLFEGRAHGGIGSLLKWNGMSNADGNYQEYSSFLQVMNLLFNSIPFQRYVSGYSQMGMNHAPDQYFHGRVRKKECGGGRARTETKEHFNFHKAIERIIRRVLVLPIDNDHE